MKRLMTPLVVSLAGVVILCLLAWIVGPYFAFGSLKPLDGVWERVFFTLLAFAVWGGVAGYRYYRAKRSDERLQDDLSRSAARAPSRDSELAGKFDEALKALKQRRGRSFSLYQLPWYVIIGPPGAGKTTAIQNSGVEFPLSQRFGKDAVRGIGGTRNCDWWFTDRAVLLDTAGRYVTQDSDAASDAEEWREFLRLVRRHRRRRPVNGVLLAISVSDLLSMDEAERGRHVLAVRERLEELNREFGLQLPVYVLFTKVDLINGFQEFFEDLSQSEREQVWGVTGSWSEDGSGDVIRRLDGDFDDLVRQLSRRLVGRMSTERDLGRRVLIQGFPQQFAALKPRVGAFLRDVFEGGFDERMVLRGFYFTSGTQVGVPFDQLIEVLGRGLGVNREAGARETGRSYFLTHLLNDVVFGEAGLVGRNRRLELKLLAAKTVTFAAVGVLAGLLLLAWIVSYNNNAGYLADVGETLAGNAERLDTSPSVSYQSVLPRLNALREVYDVARRHQDDVPWSMSFGLYQGDEVAEAARSAYRRELNALLLPLLSRDFQQAVVANADDVARLYEYLKGYLMLIEPEHFDSAHVGFLSERILAERFDPDRPDYERLVAHTDALLGGTLAPVERNDDLVEGARATLRNESLEALMFSRLAFDMRAAHRDEALDLADAIGLNAATVFSRASTGELDVEVPYLYTADGFRAVLGRQAASTVASFVNEGWVFGAAFTSRLGDTLELARRLEAYYEARYIAYWNELLADLRLNAAPSAARDELLSLLDHISRNPSPLDGVLRLVVEHTDVAVTGDDGDGGDGGAAGALGEMFGRNSQRVPGRTIARHFEPLRQASNEVGRIKQAFSDLYVELVGSGRNTPAPGEGAAARLRSLAASQPEPLRAWIAQVGGSGQSLTMAAERRRIGEAWRADVLPVCRRAIAGRYPLERGEGEIPIGDFSRFFGPDGVLDRFFDQHLASFVDRRGRDWQWNEDGRKLGISTSFLDQLEQGARVRDAFFAGGGQPRIGFSLTPQYLDAAVDRVVVSYDGQPRSYSHGPQIPWDLQWPPADSRRVEVVFHLPGGEQPALSATGVWAVFRLLESADVRPEYDAGAFVSFTEDGRSVTFRLQADSVENPFVNNALRGFRCAAGV